MAVPTMIGNIAKTQGAAAMAGGPWLLRLL
jgi:hypothetical protein